MDVRESRLHQAIAALIEKRSVKQIGAASHILSDHYRHHRPSATAAPEDRAIAYLAARMPATFAAIAQACKAAAQQAPEFHPRTMLDLCAGPGTGLWAATDIWPMLIDVTLLEALSDFIAAGQALAAAAPDLLPAQQWQKRDIADGQNFPPAELVILSYGLNEIPEAARGNILARAWDACSGILILIEPGTPQGFACLRAAREHLLSLDAHMLAPCPHRLACPIVAPDWCHFSVRVARSRLHRQVKGATVPFEDEKFTYLAVSRFPATATSSRILTPPRHAKAGITFDLCQSDGQRNQRFTPYRQASYKHVRRLGWGDAWEDKT